MRSIFLMILLVLFMPISAGELATRKTDSRIPTEEVIKNYQKQKRFQYYEDPIETDVEPTNYSGDKLARQSEKVEGASYVIYQILSSPIFKWVCIILVVGIIVLLIFRFGNLNLFSRPKQKLVVDEYDESDELDIENIEETKFERLIRLALTDGNYRLATRYLFLQNLQALSEKGLIKWRKNKTNHSYLTDLKDTDLRQPYLHTTLIFDYVWYGEFPLEEQKYNQVATEMESFHKTILNHEKR